MYTTVYENKDIKNCPIFQVDDLVTVGYQQHIKISNCSPRDNINIITLTIKCRVNCK